MGRAKRWIPAKLPAKLKKIREDLRLSQDAMLRHLGYSQTDGLFRSNISAYELGKTEPPSEVLLAYARAANVYVDVLIDDNLELPEKLSFQEKSGKVHAKR